MANYKQIAYGSQGSDVTELQKLLKSNGYDLAVDGIFGNETRSAVMNYQKDKKLAMDGIVGDQTWSSLTSAETADTNQATTAPETTTEVKTPEVPEFTYDPFKVSESTASAAQKRQELEGNKPGDFTYDAYEKSDVVKQAEALLQQQLANKPGEYQSQWQTQLDDTLNKILNREKFSYDLNGDALYQQYKDQYTLQGQQAMMDTMGMAQAMTGGYGNSYAQTVGQQTYQGYLQQLNNKVPELYQLALDQYNREGDELYNQYGLYADRENLDYNRYRDTVSDYNYELDRLTEDARYQAETDYDRYLNDRNFGYGQYRDSVADWQNEMSRADEDYWKQYGYDYDQYVNDRNFGYGQYRDQISDSQWDQAFDYQKEQDRIAQEQWQAEFEEAQRQFNIANDVDTGSSSVGSNNSNNNNNNNNSSSSSTDWAESTVASVQARLGVTVDGVVGPETQAALDSLGITMDEAVSIMTGSGYDSSANPLFGNTAMSRSSTSSNSTGSTSKTPTNYAELTEFLDDTIDSGTKKSDVNEVLRLAYKSGTINQKQYQTLVGKYAPRGYTY